MAVAVSCAFKYSRRNPDTSFKLVLAEVERASNARAKSCLFTASTNDEAAFAAKILGGTVVPALGVPVFNVGCGDVWLHATRTSAIRERSCRLTSLILYNDE